MLIRRFWRRFLAHFARFLLAAVLLYIDQRLFLPYAFTILLGVLDSLGMLHSAMNAYHFQSDAKLIAVVERLKISDESLDALIQCFKGQMSDDAWKSLEDDIYLVRNA